jgi:hypothetical protein
MIPWASEAALAAPASGWWPVHCVGMSDCSADEQLRSERAKVAGDTGGER